MGILANTKSETTELAKVINLRNRLSEASEYLSCIKTADDYSEVRCTLRNVVNDIKDIESIKTIAHNEIMGLEYRVQAADVGDATRQQILDAISQLIVRIGKWVVDEEEAEAAKRRDTEANQKVDGILSDPRLRELLLEIVKRLAE